ncbi:hypothetical protein SRAA_1284 [Serpentinimonas raichei]|uniref:Transposase n=1 Tax=Serpentinimonas raichei TaxID=1458425 RepID=A0A060NNM6_9BURK|nr:hypothetical protein SRAA_1284 [Serpentinimonas raichei]
MVGRWFKRIKRPALLDPKYPVRSGIANNHILKCYLGLLTLGKHNFEAVKGFCSQWFSHHALGRRAVPSCATMRQRWYAWAACDDVQGCAHHRPRLGLGAGDIGQ